MTKKNPSVLPPEIKIKERRHEKKFRIPELTRQELELWIKLNPAMFTEIHHERRINSIYFDTPNFEHYFDNAEGSPSRIKVRIRWYGDLGNTTSTAALEIKRKNGNTGTKKIVEHTKLKDPQNIVQLANTMIDIDRDFVAPEIKFSNLEPVLLTTYIRRYYMSADQKIRLTVDSNMEFFRINRSKVFWEFKHHVPGSVMELKYPSTIGFGPEIITQHMPFRVTKSSKYVMGIETLYNP